MIPRHTPNHTHGNATVFATRWHARPEHSRRLEPDPLSSKGLHLVVMYAPGWPVSCQLSLGVVDDFGSLVPVEAHQ